MVLVKNTRQPALALMVGGMNWAKKDVLNVNYSSTGMDYGVPAVVVYCEANLGQKKSSVNQVKSSPKFQNGTSKPQNVPKMTNLDPFSL